MKLIKRLNKSKAGSARYFWLGFFFPLLVAGIAFAAMGIWPFGDKMLLIVDSLHQYLPFYTDFHEKLTTSGSLLFSFSGGLGYNFWSTYAYYLASPFNFLIVFVPTSHVCDFMDLMILLKIALAGGCFSWYLHKRNPREKLLPIVFGLAFALSNFVIGYYFNLMWLDSIAVLPLIMYGIEQIVKGKSGRFYAFSLFYALWCNYYIGFMLCIFACLYFLICWISSENCQLAKIIKSCFVFGWYSLLSGGMAAWVLFPAFMGLSTSESMQGNSFPKVLKFYTSLWDMLENHLPFLEPVNISSTQVGLNAYCGVFILMFAILFYFDKKISFRKRIAYFLTCALFLLSFAINFLNYIWHGFHIQNGLPNRFAFLYIAILLCMAYDVAGHISDFDITELVAAFLLPIGFIIARVMDQTTELEAYIYLIAAGLLIIYLALMLMEHYLNITGRKYAHIVLACVMFLELSANAVYGISCNGTVTRSLYLNDQKSYQTLMAAQKDEEFFRSEIDRQRMRNVTMFGGGNALVMFNSTMHGSVIDFCDALGIEARTNKNGYQGVTKLMNDVFGIRYVATPSGVKDTFYMFDRLDADGELTLYKNDNALSLGFMTDPALEAWDTTSEEPLEVQNSFVSLACGMDDIFVLDRYIDMEDGETYELTIPKDKQVYICIDKRVKEIKLNTPEYSKTYTDYTDHLYFVNGIGEDRSANFTVTLKEGQSSVQAEVYTCANKDYQKVIDYLKKAQLQNIVVKGRTVTGEITADRDGLMLLTTPYDEGWDIRVDGVHTPYQEIGGALIGVSLTQGTHNISMIFIPPGYKKGLILSLISCILMLLSVIVERKMKKNRKEKGNTGTMEITFSEKAQKMDAGSIFTILNTKKNEMLAQGKTIYNLSIGTPDFKPPQHIIDAVSEAAKNPENYKYAIVELPELLEAAQKFFKRRFDIDLAQDEMMTMYGSQEGMAHIAWSLCDPGDIVLAPNPGYQIFSVGPYLCDAKVVEYPLDPKNKFLPDLSAIPEEVAKAAKLIVVSYPGNPCCALAPDSFYEELIAFAKKYNIVVLHDNAYSDLVFGRQGGSFLQFEGAKEVGIEFYSLSKTFNYTGARVSFAIGNREVIQKFKALRTQYDYGTFLPVQYGAIAALNGPFEGVIEQCKEYELRSRTLSEGLRSIGWNVPDSEGTMFLWAPLPDGYTDCEKFTFELMEKAGVVCVPGTSFGTLGEGYVRMALVLPPEELKKVVESIRVSGIIH